MVPDPFIVRPSKTHKHSMIVLHGRGDTAFRFGNDFLHTKLPDGQTIEQKLPNTKFIFPYGTMRIPVPAPMYQWYQLTTLTDPSIDQQIAKRGLLRSSKMVHKLIRREAILVGFENVVLGGLSQGCATMLTALCLWTGPPIQAAFGMSGWFPMHKLVSDILETRVEKEDYKTDKCEEEEGEEEEGEEEEGEEEEGEEEEGEEEEGEELDKPSNTEAVDVSTEAVEALREFMTVERGQPISLLSIPMFIGHGDQDQLVASHLGQEAADCWKELGCQTEWHEYRGLHHWYNGEELADVVTFIEKER